MVTSNQKFYRVTIARVFDVAADDVDDAKRLAIEADQIWAGERQISVEQTDPPNEAEPLRCA